MPLVATLIADPDKRDLSPELVEMARASVGALEIKWLEEGVACDFPLMYGATERMCANALRSLTENKPIDFVIQKAANRKKKILIADMDSTMIDQECIDELADKVGFKEQVSEITAKAMNGEIPFEDAIHERVALLEGLDISVIDEVIKKHLTLTKGGKTLLNTMKENGAYTALVSGGFTQFTSKIAKKLGFDEHHANQLIENEGKLTGKVHLPVLGASAKVDTLHNIANAKGFTPDDVIAVGDGANDLPMLQLAGTGVALHAKPHVAAEANIKIDHSDLTSLLYIQGYKADEIIHA